MSVMQSFSGAHPFRPQCVIDVIVTEWAGCAWLGSAQDDLDVRPRAIELAAEFTVKIEGGTCPRCDGALDLGKAAGSRTTRCRCVPICPTCGADENNQGILGNGLSQTWRWPLLKGDITRRKNKAAKMPGAPVTAFLSAGDDGKVNMLTEDGVSELRMRPHPGGWSEFGYDDTEDRAERDG